MAEWDYSADIVVVGTGAAGLSASLTARELGLDVIMLEKGKLIGGSTALAGGGMWIPNNHFMKDAGVPDSPKQALEYLDASVGDEGPSTSMVRKKAFIENAPAAIAFYEKAGMRFRRTANYPDYYMDIPGASTAGRGIESVIFDMRKVDAFSDRLVKRVFPRNMPLGTLDVANFVLARRTVKGFLTFTRIVLHYAWAKATGQKLAGGGAALLGQLLYQTRLRQTPLWMETTVTSLIEDGGKVQGVVAQRDGKTVRIEARRAVLLGGGGFARNAQMRTQYQPAPVTGAWTSASPSDTGNAIQLGMELGAATSLMGEAWWGPVSVLPNGMPMFLSAERPKPGSMVVDQAGDRFMNEAQSYVDAVHEMFKRHEATGGGVPAWLIMDQRNRNRYQFGMLLPGQTPQDLIDAGYLTRADTLEELAGKCNMDPAKLRASVERFNGFSIKGVDEDFGRGGDAYDRYFGDPLVKPNPCLGPLTKPPYYAVRLYPGDLGTKGGLVTDEFQRVLRPDGTFIAGLYASGNTAASLMGRRYPGPGVTLGPALTHSYIAMHHVAQRPTGAPQRSLETTPA
jgi:3-oxosteroid 1-dehydrogenase